MNGADVNLQTDMNKDNSPEQSAGDASGVSSKGAGMRPCSHTDDNQNGDKNFHAPRAINENDKMGLGPLAPPITKHVVFNEEESIQDWPSGEGPGEDEQEEIEETQSASQ